MLERIIVIGCPGSGKTTLAKRLSAALHLPLIHLDRLGWRGTWESTPPQEFDRLLAAEISKPRWVIDGNYDQTLAPRLAACDTVIYLDLPRIVCLWGAFLRVAKGRGKSRPVMGGNCPERFDLEFFRFIWGFNSRHRKEYLHLLQNQKHLHVVILKSHRQAERFLRALPAK